MNTTEFAISNASRALTPLQKRYAAQFVDNTATKAVELHGLGFMEGQTVVGTLVSYKYWAGEAITVRVMGRELEFGNFTNNGEKVLISNENPHWFLK